MAWYKAKVKSFVGYHHREEGAVFEHDFPKGATLGPNLVEVEVEHYTDDKGDDKVRVTRELGIDAAVKAAAAQHNAAKVPVLNADDSEYA